MLSKSRLVVALAFVACGLVREAASIDQNNPGDWLARELGLDDPKQASRVIGAAAAAAAPGAPPSARSSGHQVDPSLVKRQQEINSKVVQHQFKEALTLSEPFVAELVEKLKATSQDNRLALLLAYVYYDRAVAYANTRKLIEASLEAFKMRSLCNRTPDCPVYVADELIRGAAQQMQLRGPLATLGVQDGSDAGQIKRQQRNYMIMLHPDKNGHLDEEAKQFRQELFTKVQEAAKAIKQQQQGR